MANDQYSLGVLKLRIQEEYNKFQKSLNEHTANITANINNTRFGSLVSSLRASTGTDGEIRYLKGYILAGDGGEGAFRWSNDVSIDDGGTILNADGYGTSSVGWRRIFSGPLNVQWFGAIGNGDVNGNGTDDTVAIQRAINAAIALNIRAVHLPACAVNYGYLITSTINIPSGIRLTGAVKASTNGTPSTTIYWRPALPSISDACFRVTADNGNAGGSISHLLIYQAGECDSNGAGAAIHLLQTSAGYKPSWFHIHDCMLDATSLNPWTYGVYIEGTESDPSNYIRDNYVERVRVTGTSEEDGYNWRLGGAGIKLYSSANTWIVNCELNNGSRLLLDAPVTDFGTTAIWVTDSIISQLDLGTARDIYLNGGRVGPIRCAGESTSNFLRPDFLTEDPTPLGGTSNILEWPDYISGVKRFAASIDVPNIICRGVPPSPEADKLSIGLYVNDPVPRNIVQADKSLLIGADGEYYDISLTKRASTWSPLVEGGCILWHRADLHLDRDRWDDLSGNANNATQDTASNRVKPVRAAYGNFRDVVRGGTVPGLDYASAVSLGTETTIAFVTSRPTLSNAYLLSNATGSSGIIGNFTGSLIEWFNGADRYTLANNPSGMHAYVVTQINGGALNGYVDGYQVFSHTATVALPSIKYLLNTAGNANGWNGDVAEIIIFNHVMPSFTALNGYFETFHDILF